MSYHDIIRGDDAWAMVFDDGPTNDAFGRQRVSTPETIFDSKQLYDNQPLFWDDQEVSGGSTMSSHSTNTASTTIGVADTTAGKRVRQTFMRFNYQPGKALEINEPVLTPNGFRPISELTEGDEVFDGEGNVTTVVGTASWSKRNTYRITFDDGTWVDADEEHDWDTIVRQNSQKGNIRTISTKQMLEEYGEEPPQFARWRIPAAPHLKIEQKEVPLDGYKLGAILGDGSIDKTTGHTIFTTADAEILDYLGEYSIYESKPYHYGLSGTGKLLRELGLVGKNFLDKFVPKNYLFNDKEVRLAVLQGLMDTDGTVDKRDGTTEYNTASKQLAEDVAFLVRSLGGQAKIRQREAYYSEENGDRVRCNDSYRVRVISPVCPFRLARKKLYWKPRKRISFDRYIHSIKPIGTRDTKCIEVASQAHTFLTRNHIVTHNSQLILCTGTLQKSAGGAGITRGFGYYDDNNGFFLQDKEGDTQLVKRSYTTGSAVDTEVNQNDWNLDTMDGDGPSKITLDFTKSQILFIDLEWLGVGRVRMGFVVDGKIYYCHEFNHANNASGVYMSTPNLPLRYEIANDGTGAAATLEHICGSVMSEGGTQKLGILRHADSDEISCSTAGTRYVVMAGRLKSTHLGLSVDLENVSALVPGTNDLGHWELVIGGTPSDTLTFNGLTNSGVEVALGNGTITHSGGTEIDGSYVSTQQAAVFNTPNAARLGSAIDGTPQVFYLVFVPQVNNTDVVMSVTWREVL